MAEFRDYFVRSLAIDDNDSPLADAEFEVYDINDTAMVSPLTILDMQDVPGTTFRSGPKGVFSAFQVPGYTQVLTKSPPGEVIPGVTVVTPLTSLYATILEAGLDPDTVAKIQSDVLSADRSREQAAIAATAARDAADDAEAIVGLTSDAIPRFVILLEGDDIDTPRPTGVGGVPWPGPVVWNSQIGRPANFEWGRDFYYVVEKEPAPFPLSFTSLEGWWDPALAVRSGPTITSVPDRSPHERTMLPVPAGGSNVWITAQPQGSSDALNGTPAMVFPGVSAMKTDAFPAIGGPVTVGCVAQLPALSGATQTLFNQGSLGNITHTLGLYRTESGGAPGQWGFRRGGANLVGGAADGSPHTFVAVYNGSNSRLYVDGVLVASGDAGAVEVVSFMLGLRNTGSAAGPAALTGGRIGDIFLLSEALTTDGVAAAHEWLASRAGL